MVLILLEDHFPDCHFEHSEKPEHCIVGLNIRYLSSVEMTASWILQSLSE